MASYIDKRDTKLKWHRFTQIILMPLSMLITAYAFYEVICVFFGANSDILTMIFTLTGLETGNIYRFLGPAILVLFALIGLFVLEFFAFIGSFRWHKYALVCWLALLLIQLFFSIAAFYALFNRFEISAIVSYFALYGLNLSALFVRIILIALFALTIVYHVLSIFYYLKRRKLFRKKKDFPKQVIARTEETDPQKQRSQTYEMQEPAEKEQLQPSEMIENTTSLHLPAEKPAEEKVTGQTFPIQETPAKEESVENTSSLEKLINQDQNNQPMKEDTPQPAKVLYCNKCGARILRDDAVYCSNCGAKLAK